MANSALAYPALLLDPGFLYWAPLGSTLPTNTVIASAFSDTWPAAWVPMGMTESGTDIDINMVTSPILAAEQIEPISYRTTDRTGTISFQTKSITATWMSRAYNGSVLTVTGTTTTTLTRLDPPAVGTEVRAMIGFESLDSTYRFVGFQCFNSGSIKKMYNKAPANTFVPWTAMLEKPATTQAFVEWYAGVVRA